MIYSLTNIMYKCKTADSRGLQQVYLFLPEQLSLAIEHPIVPAVSELALLPQEKFCTIEFDKLKGSFNEQGDTDDKGGDFHIPTVTLTISRSRLECDTLIARLRNRKVHLLVQDYTGAWRFVRNLRLTYEHKQERGTNGYTLTFKGKTAQKSKILVGQIAAHSVPSLNISDVVWIDKNGQGWRVYVTTRGELVTLKTDNPNGIYYYNVGETALVSDFV